MTRMICFVPGIRGLMSELYSILEYILQMTESLAAGLRQNSTQTLTVNPSKITDATKVALRQLAIGEEGGQHTKGEEYSSFSYVYLSYSIQY